MFLFNVESLHEFFFLFLDCHVGISDGEFNLKRISSQIPEFSYIIVLSSLIAIREFFKQAVVLLNLIPKVLQLLKTLRVGFYEILSFNEFLLIRDFPLHSLLNFRVLFRNVMGFLLTPVADRFQEFISDFPASFSKSLLEAGCFDSQEREVFNIVRKIKNFVIFSIVFRNLFSELLDWRFLVKVICFTISEKFFLQFSLFSIENVLISLIFLKKCSRLSHVLINQFLDFGTSFHNPWELFCELEVWLTGLREEMHEVVF